MSSHPSVLSSSVVPVDDDICGQLARAVIHLRIGHCLEKVEIENFVNDRVADFERLRGGIIIR